MGVERRLIIIDESDWTYINHSRKKTVKAIEGLGNNFEVEADIDFMIIVDIGKADVENVVNMLRSKNIPYDNIYIQKENYPELLKGPSIHELGFIKEMLRK